MKKLTLIGIAGAGQMGVGIAQTALMATYDVYLYDVNKTQLDKAQSIMKRGLEKLYTKGKISEDPSAILQRLKTTEKLKDFSACDFIIEATPEQEEIKSTFFKTLTPHLAEETLLASNTSSLSITRLARSTDRPERFVGMHFMNPVPLMPLVEIIRGLRTSDDTYQVTKALAERMGKSVVVSSDTPGFIINRLLMPMINEAIYALYEGVSSKEDIDQGMKLGTHHPMGPLELADFIGLDTCLSIMRVLHHGLGESKYRPCPLLVQYVDAGWLGKKTGRGFYAYSSSYS